MVLLLSAIFLFISFHVEVYSDGTQHQWVQVYVGNDLQEWVDLNASIADPIITEDNVTFYLSNRLLSSSEILKIGDTSNTKWFQNDWKTAFTIHGFSSDHLSMQMIVDAYLSSGKDYNVINVDWSGPANLAYAEAIRSLEGVGAIVAQVVDFLVENGLNLQNVNIVGWSLGAHVAGVAGNKTEGSTGRVTGLDPAGPLIEVFAPQSLLRPSFAANVAVIHTDEGLAGYVGDLGHIDFYPNNGSYQPGCGDDIQSHSCSHGRAPRYFAESITTKTGFVATKCSNWEDYVNKVCSDNPTLLMGEFTPNNETGEYYLQTNSESPFAMGYVSQQDFK